MAQLLMVSAVVMGLSQTVARERIFEPLRARLGGKETWLGYLISCPYCVSHTLAFILVPLTGTYAIGVALRPGWGSILLQWFLSSILVTVIAAFFRVAFWFVDERQALIRKEKQLAESQAARQIPRGLGGV
jgi:phosphate/sulfate permease